MSVMGKHGISTTTPENILLGAGTIHKNLTWDTSTSKWTGAVIGATSGGNSINIKGELVDIELDGALVKVKGLAVKQGGTATMDVNFAEVTPEILKMASLFTSGESDVEGYEMFVDKPNIEEGDYIKNLAFVGKTANDAKEIIIIFENALCTSGLPIEGKNKEGSVMKLTLEAYAENDDNANPALNTLPIKIYYPEAPIV